MVKYSDGFASLIVKSVRKECFISNIAIPSDQFILSLLKLFVLSSEIHDEIICIDEKTKVSSQKIVEFLKTSCKPSIITLKMQIYFDHHLQEKTVLLHSRQKQMIENTDPLKRLICKKILKSKEDYDQLYHHFCCLIVLKSGIGDPTDNENLKETIAAQKSILTTKDLSRFTSKSQSLKEKQLHDISCIVTGILVYNKTHTKNEAACGNLVAPLETTLQKCYGFLESKLIDLDERISSLIHLAVQFYSNEEIEDLFLSFQKYQTDETDIESTETGRYIRSYIICMQQYKLYLKSLMENTDSLMKEFKLHSDQLQKRLSRVRKTVKFRNAIPVIEIYPQFRDISLSWDKLQEISTLVNNIVDIVSYLRDAFEKAAHSQFDSFSISKNSEKNLELNSKISKSIISNLHSQYCEHILPDYPDFYSLDVEFAQFCIVMFVETKGILAQGIKEYGVIKYQNKYFSFSSLNAMTKFCLTPNTYIEILLKLVFIWPESITLLHLQEWLEKNDIKKKMKLGVEKTSFKETGVQTELHPIATFKNCEHDAKTWYFRKQLLHSVQTGKQCQTVQTEISNFRKNISTQTVITVRKSS